MRPATITSIVIVVAFAIAAPILLLWTAGYRFDPRTNRLEATGIIVVDSLPHGASIAIGEERQATVTPARITGLLTREYTMTVSLPGYRDWRQTVSVEAGKTTFAEKIRLFPDNLPELVLSDPIVALAESPDKTAIAAATVADGTVEVWTVDAANGQAALQSRVTGDAVDSLAWAPDGIAILLVYEEAGAEKASIVASGSKTDLNLPGAAISSIGWSQDDPTKLVAVSRGGGFTRAWIVPTSGATPTVLYKTTSTAEYALGLPILKDDIAIGTETNATTTAVVTMKPGAAAPETIFTIPGGPYSGLPSPDGLYAFTNPIRDRISVLDAGTRATLSEVPGRETEWSARGASAMLAWDDVELSLVSGGRDVVTLARIADGIRAAGWLPDATYALLLTKNDLRAIEREPQYGIRTTTVIANFTDAVDMAITADSAFVAGTVGTKPGLYRLRLQ